MKLFFIKTQDVLKLAEEKAELERGVGDLLLMFVYPHKGHESLKNKYDILNAVINYTFDMIEENKKLKKKNESFENAIINPHFDSHGHLDGGTVVQNGVYIGHIDPRGEPGVMGWPGIDDSQIFDEFGNSIGIKGNNGPH